MSECQCTICFEPIGHGIELPCRCTAEYCAQCWDQALAKSFNACAKPRCPTCRSPVRVDYDHESDSLRFTPEADDEDIDQMRQRLAMKLWPAQVRILGAFGAAHPLPAVPATGAAPAAAGEAPAAAAGPDLSTAAKGPSGTAAAGPGEEAPPGGAVAEGGPPPPGCAGAPATGEAATPSALALLARGLELQAHTEGQEGRPSALALALAHAGALAAEGRSPKCVCGGLLEPIPLEERRRRFIRQAETWRNSERLARVLMAGQVNVVCDLCNRPLRDAVVWVCERGDNTIKHATSQDICSRCFAQHAWGVGEPVAAAA